LVWGFRLFRNPGLDGDTAPRNDEKSLYRAASMKSRYHHEIPAEDPILAHAERGSPMGEMLRRSWQPVCTSDAPREAAE
jgi:hypothetical protein